LLADSKKQPTRTDMKEEGNVGKQVVSQNSQLKFNNEGQQKPPGASKESGKILVVGKSRVKSHMEKTGGEGEGRRKVPSPKRSGSTHKESRQTLNWQPHRYSTQMFDTEDKDSMPPALSALATPRNVPSIPFKQAMDSEHFNNYGQSVKSSEQLSMALTEQLLKLVEEKETIILQMENKNRELESAVKFLQLRSEHPSPQPKVSRKYSAPIKKDSETCIHEPEKAAASLVEQLKNITQAHRKKSSERNMKKAMVTPTTARAQVSNRRKRNMLGNNSRSENLLIKSSPQAIEEEGENFKEQRQNVPSSTRAATSRKIVFYELPYSPNPKITRAQLETFKQFHNTNPIQRVRNSISGAATGLRGGESTKDTNAKGQVVSTGTGSASASRKRGNKKKTSIPNELEKLKGKIRGLVQIVVSQNKLLKKLGYV